MLRNFSLYPNQVTRCFACDFLKASAEELEMLETLATKKDRSAGKQLHKKYDVTKPEMTQLQQTIKQISDNQNNKLRKQLNNLCIHSK